MKTKVIIFILFVLVNLFSLCSCSIPNDMKVDLEKLKNISYQDDLDYQNFFQSSKICKSDKGYYFFKTPFLFFFDNETESVVKVCGRPNCNHNDINCNAFFDPYIYNTNSIWYYNQSLYIEGSEEDDKHSHYLYKVREDGSERKKICYLFRTKESFVDFSLIIHRGFAYFSNYENSDLTNDNSALYRVKLSEGSEPEIIFDYSGNGASIYRIKGYGNYLYFQAGSFIDTQGNDYSCELCRMDIHTGNYEEVVKLDWPNDYFIKDNEFYSIAKDNELYKMNLDTKEKDLIYQAPQRSYISYDGNYIFIDNGMNLLINGNDLSSRKIEVLDMEGTLKYTLPIPGSTECFFGDNNYMFAAFDNSIKAFDKTQIGNADSTWAVLQ